MNDNRDEALRRLHFLLKGLIKNEQLLERYDKAIRQYTTDGHAEVVLLRGTDKRVYYMPHREVLKEDHTTTKWKVVFDASSFAPGHLSLNECLDKGSHLSPEVLEVLLKFRTHKIDLVTDKGSPALIASVAMRHHSVLSHRLTWFLNQTTS